MTSQRNRKARCDVLDQMLKENRVIRHHWQDEVDGKERMCLYMTLVPECNKSTLNCPADVMPQWLADCVPWIDDNGSADAWPAMVRRFSAIIRRADVLSPEAWETIKFRWMRDILAEALSHVATDETWGVRAAIAQVDALYIRVLAGETVDASEWKSAETAARSAARSAAWSAESAAWSAESAARSAARSAESAARSAESAAWSAARSAAWSAESAARSAAWSAESAAWSAADNLTVKLLDHLESACTAAEGGAVST